MCICQCTCECVYVCVIMCVCICMYVCAWHVYVCVHVCVYMCLCMHACMCRRVYIYVCACVCVCDPVCLCMQVCVCGCTCSDWTSHWEVYLPKLRGCVRACKLARLVAMIWPLEVLSSWICWLPPGPRETGILMNCWVPLPAQHHASQAVQSSLLHQTCLTPFPETYWQRSISLEVEWDGSYT